MYEMYESRQGLKIGGVRKKPNNMTVEKNEMKGLKLNWTGLGRTG